MARFQFPANDAERCKHDGWCTRQVGHRGAHTVSPAPTTREWDEQHRVAEYARAVLIDLDFPAPPWADLLDEGVG